MSVLTQRAATWVCSETGNPKPIIQSLPEAASQSGVKKGELVYLVAGAVTVCADGAQVIYGLLDQDATGTTGTMLNVIRLSANDILSMCVYHATAASAITAVTQVGENYAYDVVSNQGYCDIGDTSTIALRVIDMDSRDTVGDRYGRVLVKVISTYLQSDIAG